MELKFHKICFPTRNFLGSKLYLSGIEILTEREWHNIEVPPNCTLVELKSRHILSLNETILPPNCTLVELKSTTGKQGDPGKDAPNCTLVELKCTNSVEVCSVLPSSKLYLSGIEILQPRSRGLEH